MYPSSDGPAASPEPATFAAPPTEKTVPTPPAASSYESGTPSYIQDNPIGLNSEAKTEGILKGMQEPVEGLVTPSEVPAPSLQLRDLGEGIIDLLLEFFHCLKHARQRGGVS